MAEVSIAHSIMDQNEAGEELRCPSFYWEGAKHRMELRCIKNVVSWRSIGVSRRCDPFRFFNSEIVWQKYREQKYPFIIGKRDQKKTFRNVTHGQTEF